MVYNITFILSFNINIHILLILQVLMILLIIIFNGKGNFTNLELLKIEN